MKQQKLVTSSFPLISIRTTIYAVCGVNVSMIVKLKHTHKHTSSHAKWRFSTNMKPHRCRKTLRHPYNFHIGRLTTEKERERERKSKGSKRNMSKHHFVHYHTTPNPVSSRTEPYATSHFSVSFNCYIVFHLDVTHNWCSKTKSTSLMSKIETCRLKRFFPIRFLLPFFLCVCVCSDWIEDSAGVVFFNGEQFRALRIEALSQLPSNK